MEVLYDFIFNKLTPNEKRLKKVAGSTDKIISLRKACCFINTDPISRIKVEDDYINQVNDFER